MTQPATSRYHMRFSMFGVAVALLVLLAAIPRLMSYDFSLPYIDHPDEPNKYLGAQEWRGLYDSRGYYQGYPPGYVVIHLGVQYALEAAGHPGMPPAVQVLRLVSVAADLATLVFIALTARLAANALAGLVAAAAWAVSPIVLEINVYALPDPTIALLAIIAVWLAANALLKPERRTWAVWSVAAGMLATVLKYSAFPLIAPGGAAALFLTLRDRRHWRLLAAQAALVGAVMFWLFFIYGINLGSVEREGATIRESGIANFLNPQRVMANLSGVIAPFPPAAYLGFVALGVIAFGVALRRKLPRVRLEVIGLCLLLIVVVPWLVSAYTVVAPNYRMRDVLTATTAAAVILGAAVAQVAYVVPPRYRAISGAALVALVAWFIFMPGIRKSAELVIRREPPDRRVALHAWADTNLDPGTVLVNRDNDKTFNPIWSGLYGRKWFDWWTTDDFATYTPQEWRSRHGISYVVFTESALKAIREQDADYTESMLHLRDFDSDPGRGPRMSVYRTWKPEHEAAVRFGESIRLVGYDGTLQTAQGETLTLRFYWEARDIPAANYSLFMHLTRPDEAEPLAQADGAPASPDRPTLTWDDADETIIGQPFNLTIPADLEPGSYTLRVGLYDYLTGQRLPVRSRGESLGDAWELALEIGTAE